MAPEDPAIIPIQPMRRLIPATVAESRCSASAAWAWPEGLIARRDRIHVYEEPPLWLRDRNQRTRQGSCQAVCVLIERIT